MRYGTCLHLLERFVIVKSGADDGKWVRFMIDVHYRYTSSTKTKKQKLQIAPL
jgi:hypothetical protein